MAKRKPTISEVIGHVQAYVRFLQEEALPMERVFLFGSHAKGKARRWSDIDVCVLSRRFRDRCHAIDYLWARRRDEDVECGIEPVGFNPKDFVDEDPLAWEIKRTGIEIWPVGNRRTSPHTKRRNLRAYPKTSLRL